MQVSSNLPEDAAQPIAIIMGKNISLATASPKAGRSEG
jgi:hypothetical protein